MCPGEFRVRYHVLVSDELMNELGSDGWPEGLRPVNRRLARPGDYPGTHWWLFEDDNAPLEADGERFELLFSRVSMPQAKISPVAGFTGRKEA
jgi:hypothetical protein